MAVWDDSVNAQWDPPGWLLTGHMLLWNDGSPAHVDMEPFKPVDDGWEASLMISRSALQGTRWLTLRMRLGTEVRRHGKDKAPQRAPARYRSLPIIYASPSGMAMISGCSN